MVSNSCLTYSIISISCPHKWQWGMCWYASLRAETSFRIVTYMRCRLALINDMLEVKSTGWKFSFSLTNVIHAQKCVSSIRLCFFVQFISPQHLQRYGEIVMVVTFYVQRHIMICYDHWSVTTFSINDMASLKKLNMKNHAYMITLSPSKHALWLGDLCM